jgi:hypothetical protein
MRLTRADKHRFPVVDAARSPKHAEAYTVNAWNRLRSRPPPMMNFVGREVPIRILPHDDIEVHFANGVTLNYTGLEFIISFIQTRPPVPDAHAGSIDSIPGAIVARVALTPAKWIEAVNAINDQLSRLKRQQLLPPGIGDQLK